MKFIRKLLSREVIYNMPIILWGAALAVLGINGWKDFVNGSVLLGISIFIIVCNGLIGLYYFALSKLAGMPKLRALGSFLICMLLTAIISY